MRINNATGLRPAIIIVLAAVMVAIVSCGGGGGTMVPTANPTVGQIFVIGADGKVLTLEADKAFDGPVYYIQHGTSPVVGGQTFATLCDPDGFSQYQQLDTFQYAGDWLVDSRLWLDGVPQERVSATQHKLDVRNLPVGYKGQMKLLKQVLPAKAGPWYKMYFDLAEATWHSNGGSDGLGVITGIVGFIFGAMSVVPCPDVYIEVPFEITGASTTQQVLTRVELTPESATVVVGHLQQFVARGYDQHNVLLMDVTFTWSVAVVQGGNLIHNGTVNQNGLYTAGNVIGIDQVIVSGHYKGVSVPDDSLVTIVASNPPANKPPTAHLTATPSSGYAPLSVTLDASGSYDSDGTIVKYEWDFDGNGTWDFDSGIDPTISRSYNVGTWWPKVRVTDDDGATDVATVGTAVVVTEQSSGNQPPVADVAAIPDNGEAPFECYLDASGSTDSDGNIVKYEWAFDGSSSFVEGNQTMIHTFSVGTFVVKVRVTDDDGATDVATTTVTVVEPPVDPYAGATVFITPQDPFLDPVVGDEQQFVARIYASDGLTELPVPDGATIVWGSVPNGAITQTGYFYSVFGTPGGTGSVSCTVSFPGHTNEFALKGVTSVYFVPAG